MSALRNGSRKVVTPGATTSDPNVQATKAALLAAEPAMPPADDPAVDPGLSLEERVKVLELRNADQGRRLLLLERQVRESRLIGERAKEIEPELPSLDEALAQARATGKYVLSKDGYIGPKEA